MPILCSFVDGSDFIGITDNQLTFDQNKINASFSIEIIDDDLFEEAIEDFFVLLSTDVPNLMIEPNVTRVSIIDNDSECFCRLSLNYNDFYTCNSNHYWIYEHYLCCL